MRLRVQFDASVAGGVKSMFAVPEAALTIRDVAAALAQAFRVSGEVALDVDGFALLPDQPIAVLRDNDVIQCVRPPPLLSNAILT